MRRGGFERRMKPKPAVEKAPRVQKPSVREQQPVVEPAPKIVAEQRESHVERALDTLRRAESGIVDRVLESLDELTPDRRQLAAAFVALMTVTTEAVAADAEPADTLIVEDGTEQKLDKYAGLGYTSELAISREEFPKRISDVLEADMRIAFDVERTSYGVGFIQMGADIRMTNAQEALNRVASDYGLDGRYSNPAHQLRRGVLDAAASERVAKTDMYSGLAIRELSPFTIDLSVIATPSGEEYILRLHDWTDTSSGTQEWKLFLDDKSEDLEAHFDAWLSSSMGELVDYAEDRVDALDELVYERAFQLPQEVRVDHEAERNESIETLTDRYRVQLVVNTFSQEHDTPLAANVIDIDEEFLRHTGARPLHITDGYVKHIRLWAKEPKGESEMQGRVTLPDGTQVHSLSLGDYNQEIVTIYPQLPLGGGQHQPVDLHFESQITPGEMIDLQGYITVDHQEPTVTTPDGREYYNFSPDLELTPEMVAAIQAGLADVADFFDVHDRWSANHIIIYNTARPNARFDTRYPDSILLYDALLRAVGTDYDFTRVFARHEGVHMIDMSVLPQDAHFNAFVTASETDEGQQELYTTIAESNWYEFGFGGHPSDRDELEPSLINAIYHPQRVEKMSAMSDAALEAFKQSLGHYQRRMQVGKCGQRSVGIKMIRAAIKEIEVIQKQRRKQQSATATEGKDVTTNNK